MKYFFTLFLVLGTAATGQEKITTQELSGQKEITIRELSNGFHAFLNSDTCQNVVDTAKAYGTSNYGLEHQKRGLAAFMYMKGYASGKGMSFEEATEQKYSSCEDHPEALFVEE